MNSSDTCCGNDLIVSELLSELKNENARKDNQIRSLYRTVAAVVASALVVVLLVVAGFLWYLNQYDFSATSTEVVTNSAEGVYAIIDSEGNVIGTDFTAEEIQQLLEGVIIDGEGYEDSSSD